MHIQCLAFVPVGAPAVVREELLPVITCSIQCFAFVPVGAPACGTGGVPAGHITMSELIFVQL